jgi:hypothetical protein
MWVPPSNAPRPNQCIGSPESSPQHENICGTIPRPRRSRSGETGWGATNAYIEGANYLRKEEMFLMPRRFLCPGFYDFYGSNSPEKALT